MKYLDTLLKVDFKNSCVTLGKFDGIHLGHALLLNEIKEQEKQGFTSAVITFSSYPGINFSKGNQELIYSNDEKLEIISSFDPNYLVDIPFTEEVRSMPAEIFLEDILVNRMDAKVIVIGEDFAFGHDRKGNKDFLIRNAERYGYEVKVFKKLKLNKEEVSSTLIRKLISGGNIEKANRMLDRAFSISAQLTENITKGNEASVRVKPGRVKLLPKDGNYEVIIKHGRFAEKGIIEINKRDLLLRPEYSVWKNSYYNYEIVKIEFISEV